VAVNAFIHHVRRAGTFASGRGKQCGMHLCIGTLQWAGTRPLKSTQHTHAHTHTQTDWQTDRDKDTQTTLHATSVAIGRIHALCAGDLA